MELTNNNSNKNLVFQKNGLVFRSCFKILSTSCQFEYVVKHEKLYTLRPGINDPLIVNFNKQHCIRTLNLIKVYRPYIYIRNVKGLQSS